MKKILITSAFKSPRREYDLAVWKKRANFFSVNAPMTEHFGLRFLKENVPEITILEYPSLEEYRRTLTQGWDVVGISFYINETNDAIEMAKLARAEGVETLLAGNYGALDDCVHEHFDECFTGWGEARLAKEFDRSLEKVRHPLLHMNIYLKGIRVQRWGVLFTSRGCNKTCHFCQTPRFYRKPYQLPIDELERVAWKYKQEGVGQVIVLDENFGHFDAADEVIDLLHAYGLKWNPLTRVETLHGNYDSWMDRGLCGASIGAESLNQDSLDGAKKGNDSNQTRQVLDWMRRDRILSQVFYIIGFEEDTEASIRDNILELKEYRVDSPQIQILTPYPKTILYRNIEENYGILDRDLSKYDSTNLVWDHPNISPQAMAKLLRWSNDQLFNINGSFSTFKKIAFRSLSELMTPGSSVSRSPVWAGNIDLGR